ncbi:hypothetical protein FSP39_019106 [Pinctada imbricata]|uniref:Amine oxidase domain-containing protein n=1 Tax=Pinctada imbricata TaxID=66713 RepID=A0AA88YV89_PINIB|nr:hypothetical protein FSP39_019106 [Pinctada imbricata]
MALGKELARYAVLHQRLFGKYHPFLMPRPNARVRRAIRGTVTDFLRRNKMPLIDTVAMYIYLTRGGYQQPNRLSAIYGLMWITPKVCKAFADENIPVVTYIDSGLISLFDTLIQRFNIDVKLRTNIKRIRRFRNSPNGNVEIQYSRRDDPFRTFSRYYDFLIVSPPMRNLMNVMDASNKERKIFNRQITDTYFISSLVDHPYGIRSDRPNDAFPETLLRYNFEPYASIDIFSMTQNFSGEPYTSGLTPGGFDGRKVQSSVIYQLGRLDPKIPFVMRDAENKLWRHMRDKQRIPYSVVARLICPYFTRFSVRDMDRGFIWDVLDLQGQRNTWYIGGSVTFDSAGAVIQYNNKLLRHYVPPQRGYILP